MKYCEKLSSPISIPYMDNEPLSPPRGRRTLCSRCERPVRVCLCHAIPEDGIPTSTHIVIVQHPHESRHKLSTVPILTKCLPNSTTIIARRLRSGLSPLLDSHPNAIYLFPSTHASKALTLHNLKDFAPRFIHPNFNAPDHTLRYTAESYLRPPFSVGRLSDPGKNWQSRVETKLGPGVLQGNLSHPDENLGGRVVPELDLGFFPGGLCDSDEVLVHRLERLKSSSNPGLVLIAFDATWKHAKEMVCASEEYLSRFAVRVCLDTDESVDGASIYDSELVLRKEPFGGCVSTMEAVARCLRVVERNGVEIEEKLIGVLREMVRLQAGFLKPVKPRVKLVKRGK